MAFLSQATSSWRLASSSRLPFRSMLLTLRGGPESLAPRAHQIPVSLMVFSTFLCRAFTAHGAIMVGDPLAVIAINPPDRDRWAHHVCGDVTCYALILRGDGALLHIGHSTVGILPETRIDQLVDGLSLQRLAQHRQQVPLPCATQQLVRQVLEMLPALALGIIAPTGGEQMEMGMVRPIAPMGVQHGDRASSQRLAPHGAIEVIQTLRPTAHKRTQHDRRVVVEGRPEHRGHRQNDMPIDHPLMEGLTHLTDTG